MSRSELDEDFSETSQYCLIDKHKGAESNYWGFPKSISAVDNSDVLRASNDQNPSFFFLHSLRCKI